ncbi:MAG: hypothetical protein KDI36_12345 [Pseudomonadales bacterium]|nr:hypothetical protein [Pseudomonadales bacterium]
MKVTARDDDILLNDKKGVYSYQTHVVVDLRIWFEPANLAGRRSAASTRCLLCLKPVLLINLRCTVAGVTDGNST